MEADSSYSEEAAISACRDKEEKTNCTTVGHNLSLEDNTRWGGFIQRGRQVLISVTNSI